MGELAHVSVPDLKEAEGGLRDATVLKALVATWLVDVPARRRRALPAGAARRPRRRCTTVAGRATDRITPEMWGQLAGPSGSRTRVPAQVHVRELGRRITHISRLTWRRVDQVMARPRPSWRAQAGPADGRSRRRAVVRRGRPRRRERSPPTTRPAAAGRRGGRRAGRSLLAPPPRPACPACPEMPDPVAGGGPPPAGAAARRGPRPAARVGDARGDRALRRILPEWERIRLLPHASVIHRFTVDRHVVETCIEASELIRQVARPDVLMVAALLHDIGKGEPTEHSVAGEPIARTVADRMGFDERTRSTWSAPGALAPAARRDRDHPRPRRPGHGAAGSRARVPTRRRSRC
jgi:[protein-PII] uridylyltransferase